MSDLKLKQLTLASYLVHDVTVTNENGKRFAIATVRLLNSYNQPITDSAHQIELKHCYNRYSKGPTTTAFNNLVGKILSVHQIAKPSFGDLDIITWSLAPYELKPIPTEDLVIISREEDDQLLWDEQVEAMLMQSETMEAPEEEDTEGYNPIEDDQLQFVK